MHELCENVNRVHQSRFVHLSFREKIGFGGTELFPCYCLVPMLLSDIELMLETMQQD